MPANPGNITIETSDLIQVRRDIENLLFDGQTDFSAEIASAHKIELRNISEQLRKEYPSYNEEQITALIAKVKDHSSETSLFDRRVLLTLSVIFDQNGQLEVADYYRHLFKNIPLRFFIDENDDGMQDQSESRNKPLHNITFGR